MILRIIVVFFLYIHVALARDLGKCIGNCRDNFRESTPLIGWNWEYYDVARHVRIGDQCAPNVINRQKLSYGIEYKGNYIKESNLKMVGGFSIIHRDNDFFPYIGINYDADYGDKFFTWHFLPTYLFPHSEYNKNDGFFKGERARIKVFTGFETGYIFPDGYRFGIKFSHICNYGISSTNKGLEMLGFTSYWPTY